VNCVLLEITKAIEVDALEEWECALVLQFLVEQRCLSESCRDPYVEIAECLRRALVDASAPDDLVRVQELLGDKSVREKQVVKS
jgi:hypothetical protein